MQIDGGGGTAKTFAKRAMQRKRRSPERLVLLANFSQNEALHIIKMSAFVLSLDDRRTAEESSICI